MNWIVKFVNLLLSFDSCIVPFCLTVSYFCFFFYTSRSWYFIFIFHFWHGRFDAFPYSFHGCSLARLLFLLVRAHLAGKIGRDVYIRVYMACARTNRGCFLVAHKYVVYTMDMHSDALAIWNAAQSKEFNACECMWTIGVWVMDGSAEPSASTIERYNNRDILIEIWQIR